MTGNPYDVNAVDDAATDDRQVVSDQPGRSQPSSGAGKGGRYKQQMTRANLILAGLFVAGAATVYGLSLRDGPDKASAAQVDESQVDAAILRLNTEPPKDGAPAPGRLTHDLLHNFSDYVVRRQIPLKQLGKNPFEFVSPDPQATPSTPQPERTSPERGANAGPMTPENVAAELEVLHLQSVMMGRNGDSGTAIISNNLLTVGAHIKCFTVKRITPTSVVLVCQGKEYVLMMP